MVRLFNREQVSSILAWNTDAGAAIMTAGIWAVRVCNNADKFQLFNVTPNYVKAALT